MKSHTLNTLIVMALSIVMLGCQSGSKMNIIIPQASSNQLKVRGGKYSRAISQHSFNAKAVPTSYSGTKTIEQFYIPVDKKNLPSMVNQQRIALVIGNGNYANAGKLANPINDARAMESTLTSLGFKVLEYEDLSQSEMKKAVDDFGQQLDNYDVSLVFYAGHGIQVNGKNYLIPIDASISSKKDVEYNAIDAGRVLAKMEDAPTKTNIIILDACRNNPFERSWRAVKINGTGGGGLAFMNAPTGSLIAYSTAPGNTAADGVEGTNGVYTSALLKHMKTPNIPIEEMFKRVRVTVENKTNKRQVSWESTSLKGDFFFKIKK